MSNFDREASAGRFAGIGLKTNSTRDSMPANRAGYLRNTRDYSDSTTQSRPQLQLLLDAPVVAPLTNGVTAIDSNLGIYKISNEIYYNRVAIDTGYNPAIPCSLVPFRPNASPTAWEYVFDQNKMTKVNPNGGTPIVQKGGIAEPQSNIDAVAAQYLYVPFNLFSVAGGTAVGSTLGARVTDTVQGVFANPAGFQHTIQVSAGIQYQRYMPIIIGGQGDIVSDVFPPLLNSIGIAAIRYYSGTTGRCAIYPRNIGTGPGDVGTSLFNETLVTAIRRGALVQVGAEVCLVLTSTVGPDGTICFETITTGTHTTADMLSGVPAILCELNPTVGAAITAEQNSSAIGTGIGTLTTVAGGNPFVSSASSFQEDDYITVGINIDNLDNLTEAKLLIDVGDGSFTQNFYYATIRPSDIQAGVDNTLTQLGVAQIVAQRAIIDELQAQESNNQGSTSSSLITPPGSSQWAQILIRIGDLTRVGNDQTLSLQNYNHAQLLFNASGALNVKVARAACYGGFQVDVFATGLPIMYRIRPRSSVTGAKGNASPEMRYAISPRRQNVLLTIPATYSDSQVDTWDIFRMGGALDKYVYVGSTPIGGTTYIDNFSDAALQLDDELETDNYEPFPSIDVPFQATATITGTVAVISSVTTPVTNILRFLPGTLVNVGQQVYTLWCRPTLISAGVYLFQFQENAGFGTSQVNIYEPDIAQQTLPYVWGPDANGVLFAVGDNLRPGVVYQTNPQNPDSASDKRQNELCAPTEPLVGGLILDGTSWVCSLRRWWQGYPQGDGTYNWVERPLGAGAVSHFAICTDSKRFFFAGSDGIYVSGGGPASSLTDEDLYNLFPHEDIFPRPIAVNGFTINPPSYIINPGSIIPPLFWLTVCNDFLFFDYGAGNGVFSTLVCDLKKKTWRIDLYSSPVLSRSISQGDESISINTPNALYKPEQNMYCGNLANQIMLENSYADLFPNVGEVVSCAIVTAENMFGDIRANKWFGDASIDYLAAGGNITITPEFLGVLFGTSTVLAGAQTTRKQTTVELNGGQLARSFGLQITWSDQGQFTKLYSWQPSYVTKPEDISDRFQDWDEAGSLGNKFVQGFLLTADTNNVAKTLNIRDSDTLTLHSFTGPTLVPNQILHNGQTEIAYSFVNGFLAHLVRFEPDSVPWRMFNIKYICQPSPELALYWQTQGSSFGLNGYLHLQRVLFAYASTATVTLTVTVDGRSYSYTLPSTAGAYAKSEVIFNSLMKGLVFSFYASSVNPFAVWDQDLEIMGREWGYDGPYRRLKVIGSTMGNEAKV
jgi:hypothetical protein